MNDNSSIPSTGKRKQFNSTVSLNTEELSHDSVRSNEDETGNNTNRHEENEMPINFLTNRKGSSGYNSCSTLEENQESRSLIQSSDVELSTGDVCCSDKQIDGETLTHCGNRSIQDDHRSTQFQEVHLEVINTENLEDCNNESHQNRDKQKHLAFIKNLSTKSCCLLQGSLLVNIVLLIVTFTLVFSDIKWDLRKQEKVQSSLCVLENHKTTLCSNHSMHLQYLLMVIQTRGNGSKPPEVAQSNISFIRSRDTERDVPQNALMDKKKTAYRLITNGNVLSLKEDRIEVGETRWYFISLQLLFKRESRLNHTTQNVIVVSVMKENSNGMYKLMTETLPILRGSQTLQTAQIMGIFELVKGDNILIRVSNPSLVYNCKGCNKVTVMGAL